MAIFRKHTTEIDGLSYSAVTNMQIVNDNIIQHDKKNAGVYDQGFEDIYSLGEVDVTTIRRLDDGKIKPKDKNNISCVATVSVEESPQLEFDLGFGGQEVIKSFLLSEPIQVLGLSSQAEQGFVANGIKDLEDMYAITSYESTILKGMGQGHVDEAKVKLDDYVHGRALYNVNSVDFSSFLLCLVGRIDRGKVFCFLDQYGLSHLCRLSIYEAAIVRNMKLEDRQKCCSEVLVQLETSERREFVIEKWNELIRIFVRPWAWRRGRIFTEHDFLERLERISDDPQNIGKTMKFFHDIYFHQRPMITNFFAGMSGGIYVTDDETVADCKIIVGKALSYFYKPRVSYVLSDFISMILCEFACEWKGFLDGIVERILRISTMFRIRKDSSGNLIIRRS